jgi:hypothetical protein
MTLINNILDHYGCRAEDWAGSKYIVRSKSGKTVIADQLPQIWMIVENMTKRSADPLDPDLIASLER